MLYFPAALALTILLVSAHGGAGPDAPPACGGCPEQQHQRRYATSQQQLRLCADSRARRPALVAAHTLILRGGSGDMEFYSEDPRLTGPVRHLVPKQYPSLWDCIVDARTGDTIFLQGVPPQYQTAEGGEWGWHSWAPGELYVTNECLWRSRKQGFPHSGAKTLEDLRRYYHEADKAGKGLIKLEKTVIGGHGELSFAGAPDVKLSGQIVLCENTTGAFRGPMTLALLSDVNPLFDQCDLRYCGDVKAAVSVQGVGWTFDNCQIRASGGTALRCDRCGGCLRPSSPSSTLLLPPSPSFPVLPCP